MTRGVEKYFVVVSLLGIAVAVVLYANTREMAKRVAELEMSLRDVASNEQVVDLCSSLQRRLDEFGVHLGAHEEALVNLQQQVDELQQEREEQEGQADRGAVPSLIEASNSPTDTGGTSDPLVVFADLPEEVRIQFSASERTGVFVRSFDGARFGVVTFQLADGVRLNLTQAERERLESMALLYQEIDYVKRVIGEEYVNSDTVPVADSRAAADRWIAEHEAKHGRSERGWTVRVRNDGRYAIVDNSLLPEDLLALNEMCKELGMELLAGATGSFGVRWVNPEQ